MDYRIGMLLIVFGMLLVSITGRLIENSGRKGIGRTILFGGYLAVLGLAAGLIIGSP